MRRSTGSARIAQALAAGLTTFFAGVGCADQWIDTHDAPATAWELADSATGRLVEHERVQLAARQGGEQAGAERIRYASAPGAMEWVSRPIPAAVVIDELVVQAEVAGSTPGMVLALDVVLPRTPSDEENSTQLRLRLRGEPATWSPRGTVELTLGDVPRRLGRRARAWRLANRGRTLDTREAYVVGVAVGLPGSGRAEQVLIHDLRVEGYVPLPKTVEVATQSAGPALVRPSGPAAPGAIDELKGGEIKLTTVGLRSDGFRIDGRPYFPRVWRWRGEPFEFLAKRGINTVWLDETPTPQRLAEAAHHRLRLLAPPPETAGHVASVPSWDRVLAWVLPGVSDDADLDAAMALVEHVRSLPAAARRPVLAQVGEGVDRWARVVDGLLLGTSGSRLGSAAKPSPLAAARWEGLGPGTPVLAMVPLDVGAQLAGQLDALLGDGLIPAWLPPAEVARALDASLAAGVVGVAFTADEGLDGADNATRVAAGWLETCNRRLRLIEPWLAPASVKGSAARQASFAGSATTKVIERDGARLTLAPSLTSKATSGGDPAELRGGRRSFRLHPAGLLSGQPLGEAAAKGSPPPPGDTLVTSDERVTRSLRVYTQRGAAAAAATLVELASVSLYDTEAITRPEREQAARLVNRAKLANARRDFPAAYDAAHGALVVVAKAEAKRREIASRGELLESSPLTVLPRTLTDHFRMTQLLAASQRGPNRLYGGSFEDIDSLRGYGWRHPAASGTTSSTGGVELVEEEAVHGERLLRLTGSGSHGGRQLIRSPELVVPGGETFEVTGWTRVEARGPGGVLSVVDSLGGEELALVVGDTGGVWRAFRLLRRAPAEVSLTFDFETHGDVTADIDGVMLRSIEPTTVARRERETTGQRQLK